MCQDYEYTLLLFSEVKRKCFRFEDYCSKPQITKLCLKVSIFQVLDPKYYFHPYIPVEQPFKKIKSFCLLQTGIVYLIPSCPNNIINHFSIIYYFALGNSLTNVFKGSVNIKNIEACRNIVMYTKT